MSKSGPSHNGGSGPNGSSPNGNLSPRAQGTWPQQRSSQAQRAAKAARVHTLTDPLGARGFRATGTRIRSETSARRKVLLASVATFAASFGVIVATNHLPTASETVAATEPAAATTGATTAASSSQALSNDAVATNQALVDLFTGRTTNGLTSSTSTTSSTTTTTKTHHDDEEGDDHGSESSSSLSSSGSTTSSSGQSTTNNQVNQSSLFVQQPVVQQPSHTRSGGS